MAVNARFEADFRSFNDAIAKAEVKLADFGKGASRVETSLNRMVDSFSGRKVIQDAALMEAAVGKIGGVSKLTESELQRVNATATTAIAKMKAMGLEVPPGLQKIAKDTKAIGDETATVTSKFGTMLGTASKIAGAFGIAFGATAVVNFGRELVNDADQLVKLSDKTDLSIAALRELRRVGADAGVSLESMTGAISAMQQRIGSRNAGTVGAIEALGLSFDKIRQMSPEQQWFEISRALQSVDDQVTQVGLGSDIMGRAFAETLPAIKQGFDELDPSIDEATRSVDAAADALNRFKQGAKDEITKRLATEINGLVEGFTALRNLATGTFFTAGADVAEAQAAKQFAEILKNDLIPNLGRATDAKVDNELVSLRAGKAEQELARVERERLEQQKKAADVIKKLAEETQRYVHQLQAQYEVEFRTIEYMRRVSVITLDQMRNMSKGLTSEGLIPATRAFEDMDEVIKHSDVFKQGVSIWDPVVDGAKDARREVDYLGASLKSLVAGDFGASLKGLGNFFKTGFKDVGKGILEGIGNSLSGGLVNLAMKGLDALGKGFAKLFGFGGPSEEQRQARDEQARFIEQLEETATKQQLVEIAAVNGSREYAILAVRGRDALMGIGKTAAEADRVVRDLLDTDHPERFEAAMKDVQKAIKQNAKDMAEAEEEAERSLKERTDAQNTLNDTLSRYKFTIEELGPALQRQKLGEQAQSLFQDWQVLTEAGVNIAAVGREMQESINAFVKDAIKTKTEVDPALRPMLESMVEMGELVDENGDKIKDLDKSGISFAMTMSEGFKSIVDEVKKLTDTIRLGLGLAIDETAKKIRDMPDLPDLGASDFEVPDIPRRRGDDIPGFANGTNGYQNFGSGKLVRLHGWEKVTPLGQADGVHVTVNVAGSVIAERDLAETVSEEIMKKVYLQTRGRAA